MKAAAPLVMGTPPAPIATMATIATMVAVSAVRKMDFTARATCWRTLVLTVKPTHPQQLAPIPCLRPVQGRYRRSLIPTVPPHNRALSMQTFLQGSRA